MKTINVSEATNVQLDWLVAKCEGADYFCANPSTEDADLPRESVFQYTTNPAQMWPIIAREGIDVRLDRDRVFDPGEKVERWYASKPFDTIPDTDWIEYGATPLIAAARCYVASKLGDVVEVPEELT